MSAQILEFPIKLENPYQKLFLARQACREACQLPADDLQAVIQYRRAYRELLEAEAAYRAAMG